MPEAPCTCCHVAPPCTKASSARSVGAYATSRAAARSSASVDRFVFGFPSRCSFSYRSRSVVTSLEDAAPAADELAAAAASTGASTTCLLPHASFPAPIRPHSRGRSCSTAAAAAAELLERSAHDGAVAVGDHVERLAELLLQRRRARAASPNRRGRLGRVGEDDGGDREGLTRHRVLLHTDDRDRAGPSPPGCARRRVSLPAPVGRSTNP